MRQHGNNWSDFFWPQLVGKVAHKSFGHAGECKWCNGIRLDVELCTFNCKHACETYEAHFCSAVVGLAEVAEDTCSRRSRDDAAVTLLAHDEVRRLCDVECTFEVNVEHGVHEVGGHVVE